MDLKTQQGPEVVKLYENEVMTVCGIGFILRMGKTPIQKNQLDAILIGLMERGRDSTGVALQKEDGEILVHKAAQQATIFVDSIGYKEFITKNLNEDIISVILHTRHYTTGHWSKNDNNHPLVGENVVLVHNGIISNHEEMFKSTGYTPSCETDSDIIRAILEVEGFEKKGVQELHKVRGSAAIAAMDKRRPGQLLIAKCSNPLEIALIEDDFIYGASLVKPLYIANKTWTQRWGFYAHRNTAKIDRVVMPTETAWLIDRRPSAGEPLQWHQEFKLEYGHSWSGNWHDWQERRGPCVTCTHRWSQHGSNDECYICDCKEYKEKTVTPANTDGKDMTRTGVEYICPFCHKTAFVPMWLNKDKWKPEKLLCPDCNKYMKGAQRIINRKKLY